MIESSLLSYLAGPGASFTLDFSDGSGGVPAGHEDRFPLEIIDDTGALTRIVRARVASDAGSAVKRVFLMISRDEYPLLENGVDPVTNAHIDSAWQQAYQRLKDTGLLIALKAQSSRDALNPFRPLFHCSKTRMLFHPPCPECGHALELCRDDAILEASGLRPYSTSLKRYLACPSCLNAGVGGVFYAKAPDSADPACVKGPAGLIDGFMKLDKGELPCARCPERAACSGKGSAHALIAPIAFYPFHLLMFEGASLNAADYLSLVSGAGPGELEQVLAKEGNPARGRLVRDFKDRAGMQALFAGDDRRFLEILFLKLSLLGEVAQHALSVHGVSSGLRFGPSLRSLWVRIPEQGGLLPAFWSFKLTVTDMDLDIPGTLPLEGPDYPFRVLGVLWFQALLRNRTQDVPLIHEGIGRVLREQRIEGSDGVFRACNVYWNPEPAPERWSGLWERALDLGRELLVGENPSEVFWNAFHGLREDIRKALFTGAPEAAAVVKPREGEDKADGQIGLILRRISSRAARARTVPDAVQAEPPAPGETLAGKPAPDYEATLVLPPAGPAAPKEAQEEYEKTMVLGAPREQERTLEVEEGEEDFRTETVIIQHVQGSLPAEAPVDLDGTAVMGGGKAPASPAVEGAGPAARHDDLEETLVMGAPTAKAPAPPGEKPPAEDMDGLAETLIIKPKKG